MIRSLLYYLIRYRQKISSRMPAGGTRQIRVWQPGSWLGQGQIERGSCCPIQMVKIQKKKFRGGAIAVNYFAEFSLNSRFLFSSVIFFQDVWAKSSGLFSVLDDKPS